MVGCLLQFPRVYDQQYDGSGQIKGSLIERSSKLCAKLLEKEALLPVSASLCECRSGSAVLLGSVGLRF